MKRGYSKPFTFQAPVVTCPECGALIFPKYKIVEGTGYTKDGRSAPRRKKSSSPVVPFPED